MIKSNNCFPSTDIYIQVVFFIGMNRSMRIKHSSAISVDKKIDSNSNAYMLLTFQQQKKFKKRTSKKKVAKSAAAGTFFHSVISFAKL